MTSAAALSIRREHESRDGESAAPRWCTREDLWRRYPGPSTNFRPTMFGLPLKDYRAEYRRRQAEGWAAWELTVRFPAPEVVAS